MYRFVVLMVLGILSFPLSAQETEEPSDAPQPIVPSTKEEVTLSYSKIVKKVAPAVVNIYAVQVLETKGRSPLYEDPFFRQFFGEEFFSGGSPTRLQRSLGSGVIIRPDGLIVTSHHVIQNAKQIKVVLSDGRELDAEMVSKEPRTDLAVIKLKNPPKNLPYLPLTDVDEIEVGDLVLAIGNPFGIGQTVTTGIISALARNQIGVGDFRSFIQTDAAINPGNSGGALVTMDGKLAGINTAILSKSGGSVGIGFAIPSNLITPLVDSLEQGGKIIRPWTGARVKTINQEIAGIYKLDRPLGVLVTGVYPKSPADKAGIKVNDLIVEADGKEIRNESGFSIRVASRKPGDKIPVKVIKEGGEAENKEIQLETPPEGESSKSIVLHGRQPLEGAHVVDLSPALATNLGVDFMEKGVLVVAMEPNGAARRVGILPGDIIKSINDQPIDSVEGIANKLTRARSSWQGTERVSWKIEVKRGNKTYTIVLQ